MTRNRKAMAFGVTVLGVMLALASVAFACTVFKGRFEVTAGGGTSKAWGRGSSMMHCDGNKAPSSAAEVSEAGGTITVEVFPTGTTGISCPASQLSASSSTLIYKIYYVNTDGFIADNGVWEWSVDCMAGASGVQLDAADGEGNKIYINSNGRSTVGDSTSDAEGSRNYTIPDTATPNTTDRAGVCISDEAAGQGNQVPIKIVAI